MTPAGGAESGCRIGLRGSISCRSRRRLHLPGPPGRRDRPRLRLRGAGSGCRVLGPTPVPRVRARAARGRAARNSASKRCHQAIRVHGGERVSVPSRSSRCEAARSRGSVEERPVHTGEVAGSIPAGTTEIDSDERHPRRGAFFRTLMKSLSMRGARSGGSPASACFLRTATAPSGSTTRVVWTQLWCL